MMATATPRAKLFTKSQKEVTLRPISESESHTSTCADWRRYGNPLITLDSAAEARLRRKIDCFVVPTVAIVYLFCFIDQANIGEQHSPSPPLVTDGNRQRQTHWFEKDLGLHGYDYNKVLSAFYAGYIIFEIPSTFACKYFGPGWWIPSMTIGFGVLSIVTGFCTNIQNTSAVRFLLGICETGMLPGIAYYLSRWYRRNELVFRLSCYIMMSPLAGAFGGLLASGILKLDHVGYLHTWRMIFVIEGIITCGLGLLAFFTLTDRPETARWLRPEEKDLAIALLNSERTATTEVLDSFSKKKILKGILNPVTLMTAVIFGFGNITAQGLAFFAPTIYHHHSVVSHSCPPSLRSSSELVSLLDSHI